MSEFLRNTWYVAGWSEDLGRSLLARTFLDIPVVLFRREDGTPVALHDRCPHRFAPLSRGHLQGDVLQCGYHGLCFDASGVCVGNPHSDARPSAARVQSFPIVDRHSALWIWMGDPAKADAALIPDFALFSDTTTRRAVRGTTYVKANYLLDLDNLLDLSHIDFVHTSSIGRARNITRSRLEVTEEGRTIWAKWLCSSVPCPPQFEPILQPNGRPVDYWLDMRWDPAGVLKLEVGVTFPGRPRSEGYALPQAHFLTPETAKTTHYFWGISRDNALDSKEFDQELLTFSRRAFDDEDRPMLEACQERMPSNDFWTEKPVLLPIDKAAVTVRRAVQKLIDAEAGATRVA